MAKKGFTDEDEALLADLGIDDKEEKISNRTPREERVIAGFEDIERFFQENGRIPAHGEDNDIFERLYAVRLDKIRTSEECRSVLTGLDQYGLLEGTITNKHMQDEINDDALLAELGVFDSEENDITKLTHVKPRAEIKAAEEVARRVPCSEFHKFKPLFIKVQEELRSNIRQAKPFERKAEIEPGAFFIVGGQKAYVAEKGDVFFTEQGHTNARLRVVYDNGTESAVLMRSLQRALHKDEAGRRITNPSAGPLFSGNIEENDNQTGTIYVLRSKSDHPFIQENRDVIHKIGVTGDNLQKRLVNAKLYPTFLMADVEVIATYELANINPSKLENLIHKFFESAKLNIDIKDRFGTPVTPREWFLVPLFVINEAVEKIKDGSIVKYEYDSDFYNIVLIK